MSFLRYKSLLFLFIAAVAVYLFVFYAIFSPIEKLNAARQEELEANTQYQDTLRRVDFDALKEKSGTK